MSVTDTFPTAGSLSANWQNIPGQTAISILTASNAGLATTGQGLAIWIGNSFTNAQYAEITVGAAPNSSSNGIGPIVRMDGGGNGYVVGWSGSGLPIYVTTFVGGSYSATLFYVTPTVNPGDRIGIGVVGSTLTLYLNGAVIASGNDSTYSSGSPGMYVAQGTSTSTNQPTISKFYATGFGYKGTITIDRTKCGSSNSSDFPVLFLQTDSNLKTVANGGLVQNTVSFNGQTVPADLIFTSDSAGSNLLNWDVASYNATTGKVEAWIQVGTLSVSIDTTIYVWVGNSGVTTYQGGAVGAAWDSNYKFVGHLANGSTLSVNDSTSNGMNGTNNGASAGTGQIDGCASLNGSSNYIDLGGSGMHVNSARTLQAWINQSTLSSSAEEIIDKGYSNGGGDTVEARLAMTGTGKVGCYAYNGSNQGIATSSATLSALTWYLIHGTWDGTNWNLYINGALDTGPVSNTTNVSNTQNWAIGADETDIFGNVEFFNGLIDEVRISSVARSADWITAEYNNQSSPSTFYTWSGLSAVGGTTYTQSLAASTALFAAAVSKKMNATGIPQASTIKFSATFARRPGKSLAASSALASAAIAKQTGKSLGASSEAFAGTMIKKCGKSLSAACASMAATISKQVSKSLAAATSSFAGSPQKQTGHAVAAAMSSLSGAINKQTGKALKAAASTWSGVASGIHVVIMNFSAAMATFGAAITKQTGKNQKAATSGFSTSMPRKISRGLAATVANFSASISKQAAKSLSAASGRFAAAIGSGAVHFANFSANMSLFAIAIGRETSKSVSANSSAFGGAVSRKIGKLLPASAAALGATTRKQTARGFAAVQAGFSGSASAITNVVTSAVTWLKALLGISTPGLTATAISYSAAMVATSTSAIAPMVATNIGVTYGAING